MSNFKKYNLYVGLFIGLFSSIIYLLTKEATISFWDCGEFVACAYKLENPHPAGAPTFVIIGRVLSILFGDSPHTAVHALNSLSAVSTGLSMMFIFWITTFFARRILLQNQDKSNMTLPQMVLILGSGVIGALAATFADSIWYSAVEGEVYGLATFLNLLMYWLIIYWYGQDDKDNIDKWIVLIFFIIGFSIGVHLLNILVIPTLVFAYYFKRIPHTKKNFYITVGLAIAITGFVQVVLIQKLVFYGSIFDRVFVNTFGLPVFIGFITFFVGLFFLLRYLIRYFSKKNRYMVVLFLNSISFLLIGFSTYFVILIRANAFVPINMGNADNPVTLESYLSRDQYGSHPFLYGQVFTAGQDLSRLDEEHQPKWEEDGEKYNLVDVGGGEYKYNVVGKSFKRTFHPDDKMFFSRMWNTDNGRGNADFYANWVGIQKAKDQKTGAIGYARAPTFGENLNFFFTYQMYWMYFRYFMWNYAGRQNDIQGVGHNLYGNISTGIGFIDNIFFTGNQDLVPETLNNLRSHNKLYLLPFILGILGIFFHYQKHKKDFFIAFTFYFFNGLAIILYLNDPGLQPRERDYTHAVSYLAFALWIGLGVIYLADILKNYLKNHMARNVVVLIVTFIAVPCIMISEEWDDHDRSNKTIALSLANSFLQTCDTNALLMCYADNDTYPLWYAQEVENLRADVRVVNTSLMGIGWYVNQMKRKMNDNTAFDVIFTPNQLKKDAYQYVRIQPDNRFDQSQYYNLYDVLKNFVANEDPKTKLVDRDGNKYPYLPVTKFRVKVSEAGKAYYIKKGIPKEEILDEILFEIPKGKNILTLDYLTMLAIIATHDWQRPLCFTKYEDGAGFQKYLRKEGLVYRLVPFNTQYYSEKDLERFYSIAINEFIPIKKDPNKYTFFDETNRINLSEIKSSCNFYASLLYSYGKPKQAQEVMNHLINNYFFERDLPYALVGRYNGYNRVSYEILNTCLQINDTVHAKVFAKALKKDLKQQIAYYTNPQETVSVKQAFSYDNDIANRLLNEVLRLDSIYSLTPPSANKVPVKATLP